jgi:hypothetical protein
MRFISIISVLIIPLATACKWSEFDDLREEAWVNATERPDNGSTNWGIAIGRGAPNKLTVLGTASSVFNEIEYSPTGQSSIAPTEQRLGVFGIGNLDPQPILLADPTSDAIALVTKIGPQQVLVLEGTSGQFTRHDVFGPDTTDAAAFMVAPAIDGSGAPQPAQPIVASLGTLYGTFYSPPENPFIQVKCRIQDDGTDIAIRALGATRAAAATTDDVIVWAASGTLYRLPGEVFNGGRSPACTGEIFDASTAPQLDVGFAPEVGSQILPFGDELAVLKGQGSSDTSFLAAVDLAAMAPLGNPQTENGLKAAALHVAGSAVHVVAGYPRAEVDGVTGGKVVVYRVDPATGIVANAIEPLLHDAQPEEGQAFGRAVAVIPYNGRQVIAVAASNEVFLYFRTATLYNDDARQGR